MTHDSRVRRAPEILAYVALTIYFVWPVLATGSQLGIEDWDALLFQHASVLKSAIEYGQPPFWNPWYCGGNVLWQNPQAPLLTPVHLFGPFAGVAVAMKIAIALHYLLGFAGMHVLLRRVFAVDSFAWRFFLAGLFTLAGGVALHLSIGHATFLPYFYLPWLLWLFIAAVGSGSLRHAAGAAAVLALALWNGGVYLGVMSAVALAVFAAVAAAVRRDWRPLAILVFTGALTALFAAPRLLPVLLFVADPDRIDIRYFPPGPDVISFRVLVTSLLEPFQHRRLTLGGLKYGWGEYGNYMGAFGVFLALAAILRILTDRPLARERWLGVSLAVTAVVLLLVAIGDFGALAPYNLLRMLPVVQDLRVPTRYLLVFTAFAAATIAWVAGGGRAAPGSPAAQVIALALVIATLFLAQRNRLLLDGAFPYAPLAQGLEFRARPPAPQLDTVTDGFGPDAPMLRAMMAGRAVLRCNEPLQLPGTLDPSQPIVFSDGAAAISHVTFTPNRVGFGATTRERGARVFMNQRYARGWRSDAGAIEIDPATRLAYVTLPPYTAGRYAFRFVPRGLLTGTGLWVLGALAAAACWRRRL